MKKSLLIYCLLATTIIFAQETQSVYFLKDIVTKAPIANANIYLKNSTIGTISNEEGAFQITTDKLSELDFSHLEYKKFSVKVKEIFDSKIIFLEPNTIELEEIIVSNVPTNVLIQSLIKSSKSKLNKPIILETYYREFVSINDKFTKFTDGLIDYHVNGNAKTFNSYIDVKQSRAANLVTEEDKSINLTAVSDIRETTNDLNNFSILERILLESKRYNNYDFTLKSTINKSGTELRTLSFEPKASVEKQLMKGFITFDLESNLILEIEMESASSHNQYIKTVNVLLFKLALLHSKYSATFKQIDNKYLISHASKSGRVKIWNKKKYNHIIGFKNDVIVTNFKNEDNVFNPKSKYNERSLYKRGNNYTEKFWLNNNALVLTAREQAVVKSLEDEIKNQK